MKVTLTHDGKSVELDLTAEQMAALGLKEEKKKTGYERVGYDEHYCTVCSDGVIGHTCEHFNKYNDAHLNGANYYSNSNLASANARADRLMRQLRRFAAENGGIPSVKDWERTDEHKKFIYYDIHADDLWVGNEIDFRKAGVIYFNDEGACEKAIEIYRDELIWYFTEYEAMLR